MARSRPTPPFSGGRSGHAVAAELVAIGDPHLRREMRIRLHEAALTFRLEARHYQRASRLADAIAKFGGGSLLTATLVLVLNGAAGAAVVVTALSTLLLLIVGTGAWMYLDRRSAIWDDQADRIDAVPKETERHE